MKKEIEDFQTYSYNIDNYKNNYLKQFGIVKSLKFV